MQVKQRAQTETLERIQLHGMHRLSIKVIKQKQNVRCEEGKFKVKCVKWCFSLKSRLGPCALEVISVTYVFYSVGLTLTVTLPALVGRPNRFIRALVLDRGTEMDLCVLETISLFNLTLMLMISWNKIHNSRFLRGKWMPTVHRDLHAPLYCPLLRWTLLALFTASVPYRRSICRWSRGDAESFHWTLSAEESHPRHPHWPMRHNAVTGNKRLTSLFPL